jgi:hypothetical protein
MASEKQILAARANGARSRGPQTPEGKRRSRMNALRHGLSAQEIVIGREDPEAFEEMIDAHLDRFAPADPIEQALVEEMAASQWRLRRLWAVENEWFQSAIENQSKGGDLARIAGAFADLADSPRLALLHRYETRLNLAWQRAFRSFFRLHNSPNCDDRAPAGNANTSSEQFACAERTQEVAENTAEPPASATSQPAHTPSPHPAEPPARIPASPCSAPPPPPNSSSPQAPPPMAPTSS